ESSGIATLADRRPSQSNPRLLQTRSRKESFADQSGEYRSARGRHTWALAWVLERKAHRAGVRPYGEKLVVRRGKIQQPKNAGLPEERYRNTLIKVLLGVERSVCGSQECELAPSNVVPWVAVERQRSYLPKGTRTENK